MGYPDGYYYGQGRIICDTSTFSVGDTIRVRSMTDSSKVWNQQVATVGTALVFTVPCYDYYKICTVQDISGTPTEIGGVYKTVDYGQTLFIEDLGVNTLRSVQNLLDNHNESQLNIGDEVKITIYESGISDEWIMQVGAIDLYSSHEVIFVSKYIWTYYQFHSTNDNIPYANSTLRTKVQSFYGGIDENDRAFLKNLTRDCITKGSRGYSYTDTVWIPNDTELFNVTSGGDTRIQYPIFVSQSSRVRTTKNQTATNYWTTDNTMDNNGYADYCNTSGVMAQATKNNAYGVLPCFRLTADS